MKKLRTTALLLIIASLCTLVFTFNAVPAAGNGQNYKATPKTYMLTTFQQKSKLQAYSINGEDFFKLRDLAFTLSEQLLQFQIEWNSADNSIRITTGKSYTSNGAELSPLKESTAALSDSPFYVNGKKTDCAAYVVDGSTFVKAADAAKWINCEISSDTNAAIIAFNYNWGYDQQGQTSCVLTLTAGNNEALLNGNSFNMAEKPLIQNDIFYIPIEATVKLLGGKYSFANNAATIELFGIKTEYRIGSHTYIVNGESYEASGGTPYADEALTINKDYLVPILSGGTVYLPAQFDAAQCPNRSILGSLREYPQSKMIIWGHIQDEYGVKEIKLLDIYDALAADFRAKLSFSGIAAEVENYYVEKYSSHAIDVYVMRIKNSYKDADSMDGKVCAIQLKDSSYSTPRGLNVGDSPYRAWLLYGFDNISYSFSYKVKNGLIDSITFYTSHYFGGQL